MKRCFFLGHRDAPDGIGTELEKAIESLILESGVVEFMVGNYGRFDTIVQRTLVQLKEKYPHIILTLLLPYHPAVKAVTLPMGFDQTFYPEEMERVPKRCAIVKANRYAVEYSSHFVSYLRYLGSNTSRLVEYAKKRQDKGLVEVVLL